MAIRPYQHRSADVPLRERISGPGVQEREQVPLKLLSQIGAYRSVAHAPNPVVTPYTVSPAATAAATMSRARATRSRTAGSVLS